MPRSRRTGRPHAYRDPSRVHHITPRAMSGGCRRGRQTSVSSEEPGRPRPEVCTSDEDCRIHRRNQQSGEDDEQSRESAASIRSRSADRLRPSVGTASRRRLGQQALPAVALSAERAPCRQRGWLPRWTTSDGVLPGSPWRFCIRQRGRAGAPWRSRRSGALQSSSPVLACIIGAFRPCIAPMISSEEIPSRQVPVVERYACPAGAG